MLIHVPEQALDEHGYIQSFSINDGPSVKHEYHALAQMAYYQHQDGELDIERFDTPVQITGDNIDESYQSGLLIFRDDQGMLRAGAYDDTQTQKLLEAAYRYFTRWVRLDI
ncbi:MAG: hypothetical protein D6B25_17590 [Desulfobulbaceae bacterium]|nr:MAG: hypothetical protein D6B25_17590 [Desulfobulbaceae bacterium]